MPTVNELMSQNISNAPLNVRGDLVFNVKDAGAKGDGIKDDSQAIQKAISKAQQKGIGTVYFPKGTYECSSLQGRSGIKLIGDGAVLQKNSGGAGTYILNIIGSETSTKSTIISGVSANSTSINANQLGFSTNDYVIIRDTSYKYATSGRNSEINTILSTNSGAINLTTRTISSYDTSKQAEIVKLAQILGVEIRGLTFNVPIGANGGCIYLDYNVNTLISDCTFSGMNDNAAVFVTRSKNIKITRSIARDGQNLSTQGKGYGFIIGESSTNCTIDKTYSYNIRENSFTDNARYSNFVNNQIESAYDSGFNTHGTGCEFILVSNNVISCTTGIGLGVGFGTCPAKDNDIIFHNNEIINAGSHGISVTSPSNIRHSNITISNNKIRSVALVSASKNGILVTNADNTSISANEIYGLNTTVSFGIQIINCVGASIKNNKVDSIPNGYGIAYQDACDNVVIKSNEISNVSSFNIRSINTNTNVNVINNIADDNLQSLGATDRRTGNVWGSKFDNNDGKASVADGGTITHNLVLTPRVVNATGSINSEIISITAMSATTFTVAIKKHDGSVGTTQNINWQASV